MRPLLLLTTLLCVLCAALAEAQHNADMVKLCGRSFLRAVVYACGGSRWKRVTADEETLQSSNRHPRLRTTAVPAMDRRWRDQRQALMSVCCDLGCQMSDLFMLC
ncbi:Relaxin-3 Insulin-like peptide INSL7 [Takifugu flavidus]|uniref:Relaxin-3 Insulin-like peptide INSL7 n=1 Tax=Takifugu flavidus TaxID=433684 RepID=A0A5C6NZ31_9TELE|nr:Relaxin-3 Insulin-like peptide INSL7 [Takifugu flavidus]